jgi:hypothetical protein
LLYVLRAICIGDLAGFAFDIVVAMAAAVADAAHRELIDKLYCCLVGHLYHLARGELLRLGSALQLPEAAAANASVLQLGKAAFTPAKLTPAAAAGSKSPRSQQPGGAGSSSTSPVKQSRGSTAGQTPGQTAAEKGAKNSLSAGVDLLLQASASGALSPRMVSQLQELLITPLCGFSMMINKYADGSSSGLTYEVHTPRLEQVRSHGGMCLVACAWSQ